MEVIDELRQTITDWGGDPAAPTAHRKTVVRFVRDEDGHDVVPPQRVEIDLTAEEKAALETAALSAQRDALASSAAIDAQRIIDLEGQISAAVAQLADATRERDDARSAYAELQGEIEPA